MRRHNLIIGFVLFIALFFGGCASYRPSLVRMDKLGPNTVKHTEGDLCVYLEEYATEEKCETAFDTDLYDEGVLPLLIMVENNGQQPYGVKVMDIVVRDEDNVLKTLTPKEAASKAKRSAVGRAIGWSLIVPIVAIPVAAVASASDTGKVNKQIINDFTAKSFQEGVIMPNKTLSGFLFIEVDKEREDLSDLKLEMTASNVDTGELTRISTSLPKTILKQKRSQKEYERRDPFSGN